jgi:NAD-dependent SIR2 family protein deacetylase
MRYLTLECDHCESTYSIEFNEESTMYATPTVCPFCGEEIDDELDKDFDEDDEDDQDDDE